MHDARVDVSAHMDPGKAVRPGRAVQRVNVDFPVDLLREIDQEYDEAFLKVFSRVRGGDLAATPQFCGTTATQQIRKKKP